MKILTEIIDGYAQEKFDKLKSELTDWYDIKKSLMVAQEGRKIQQEKIEIK